MRNKIIFIAAVVGLLTGLASAYLFGIEKKPLPPAYNPASNPYARGIYANGIVESYQRNGANINIYPEVSGTIKGIPASEGSTVRKGAVLLAIDDSVQRATAEQQKAQVELADASLRNYEDQLNKLEHSWQLDPRSVSRNDLDTAKNAARTARANVEAVRKQYELSRTLLSKYTIRAPVDGAVLSVNGSTGGYVSAQGSYDTYTQGFSPVIVMATSESRLAVRCYVDEILVHRLPKPDVITATMSIRGTDVKLPLKFERIQPFVSPKIELSSQRTERVDVRVLPVIFTCEKPATIALYPGQLVDVYIGDTARKAERQEQPSSGRK